MPGPVPSPTPVPVPVPAPPPRPDPWLSSGAVDSSRMPTRFRVSAGALMIGATTAGSRSALSGAGFGSGGAGAATTGFGGSRTGNGLDNFRRPSRSAFGGGAFCCSPPPPPPPPGPGVAMNTSRIGSFGRSSAGSVAAFGARPKVAIAMTAARIVT